MITDLQVQHELLKTALEATDNYLAVEKRAMELGKATNTMVHDFTYEMARAHDALQALGVLDQHEKYMEFHANEMIKLHGHDDRALGELPYAHIPKADFGEVEESVTVQDTVNKKEPDIKKRGYKSFHDFNMKAVYQTEEKKVWDQAKERQNLPKEKLSSASKAKAKARAKAAGRPYPNMVDNIWAARQQEGTEAEDAPLVEKENLPITEKEIETLINELTWDDIVDLYDEDELIYEPEDDTEEVNEGISVQSRLKKRQAFARSRGKRNVARNMKLRRASSMDVLKKRAVLAARRAVYKRFLRGRDKQSLSAAEKDRIEQQVSRMKFMQQAIAVKMLPKMRSIEQKRLAGYRTKKSTAPKLKPSKAPAVKRK